MLPDNIAELLTGALEPLGCKAEGEHHRLAAGGGETHWREINDTALNQLILAPLSMFLAAGYQERSDDGYKKSVTLSGYPGYEEWQKNDKHAELTVLVDKRFMVKADGSRVDSPDVVRAFVEAVDLKRLAAVK